MDDIVIVIITLLVVVVGAINQFRKKQKQPLSEEPQEKEPSGLNFWEELLEVEKDDVPQAFNEPVFENSVEPVKITTDSIKSPAEEVGVHAIKKNFFEEIIKDSEIGSAKKRAKLPEGFTLRRAIIFSEIIKQKYF
ncbi:MAG: hypothetical protein HQ541_12900 [Mariniphaga sp.]|nr:hypothetical protein [Mariniphaga sp.]